MSQHFIIQLAWEIEVCSTEERFIPELWWVPDGTRGGFEYPHWITECQISKPPLGGLVGIII